MGLDEGLAGWVARNGTPEFIREHAMAEQAKLKPDPVGDYFQGGTFCSMEFDADPSRIIDWKKR